MVAFVPCFLTPLVSSRGEFFRGWMTGFIFYSLVLSWLVKVAGPIYLLLSVYLGFFWGVFFYLVKNLRGPGRLFLGSVCWFFLEILMANLLTGFPWLALGLTQSANRFVLPLAGYITVYGISYVVMLANFLISFGWQRQYLSSVSVILVLISLLVILGQVSVRCNQPVSGYLKILVVQENLPSFLRLPAREILEAHCRSTEKLLTQGKAELVVWPESSYPDVLNEDQVALDRVKMIAKHHHCSILLGGISCQGEQLYNTAYLISPESVQMYRKIHLVPYGEFVLGDKHPCVRRICKKIAGYLPALQAGQDYVLFEIPTEQGKAYINALICFENIFPEISWEFVNRGSQASFVITNDSWFSRSAGPYQHFAHNILRAAETGRFFVQAALTGISGVVSPKTGVNQILEKQGRVIFFPGYLRENVPLLGGKTLVVRHGIFPFVLILLGLTGGILCRQGRT
ncbi:MAG: apolipoprotein N-acyltransferase [Candidatus Omnitrophica bacterium]|nr:apolipoprotein N-acyltransferase [Candidatus Omnitrophota bacterium]